MLFFNSTKYNLKLNRYCDLLSLNENTFSLYNFLNNKYIILSNKQKEILLANEFQDLDKTLLNRLISDGFLVKTKLNMNNHIFFENHKRNLFKRKLLTISIIPTNDCNLRCMYCYSENSRNDLSMNNDTINNVCKFIKELKKKYKNHHLDIEFIGGGEPLLNFNAINNICYYLKEIEKINFSCVIVTNGTLLNEDYVKKIKQI